jgi:hypothetical protein
LQDFPLQFFLCRHGALRAAGGSTTLALSAADTL